MFEDDFNDLEPLETPARRNRPHRHDHRRTYRHDHSGLHRNRGGFTPFDFSIWGLGIADYIIIACMVIAAVLVITNLPAVLAWFAGLTVRIIELGIYFVAAFVFIAILLIIFRRRRW